MMILQWGVLSFRLLLKGVNLVFILYMLLFFIVMGLHQIKDVERYPILDQVISWEEVVETPVRRLIREQLPHTIDNEDISGWIFISALFIVWTLLNLFSGLLLRLQHTLLEHSRKNRQQKQLAFEQQQRIEARRAALATLENQQTKAGHLSATEIQEQPVIDENSPSASLTRSSSHGVEFSQINEGTSRDEILELMAKAKKLLEEQRIRVAFLSIDVVNSTGMKVGEDPAISERDFRQYKKLVEGAINAHNYLKAAWTPDGVMICLPTATLAIRAGQQVIHDLIDFNENIKAMRSDFMVRCGVNAGEILYDESIPMEEMSDRTIDIAGHMQKYAQVSSIYCDKLVLESEDNIIDEFQSADREIDGCETYVWQTTRQKD